LSLRTQLIIGVTGIQLLLVAGFTTEVVMRQRAFLAGEALEQVEGLARLLALNSSSWVLADDGVGLGEVVSAHRAQPGLRYAMVVSPEGRVLAHTDVDRVGSHLVDPPSLAVLGGEARLQVVHSDEALLDVAAPVLSSTGACVAWVRIGQGQEGMTRNLAAVLRAGLIFGLVAMLLGAIFATAMASWLTSRIRGLLGVSQGVLAGRTDLRAWVRGGDEIAELGASFDAMLDGIQRREKENARLEAELTHSQRLESVGRLAGGVAHDFNNLLTAIVGNAELLQGALPEGPLRDGAREILDAGHRATEVTRGLLVFSRKQLKHPCRLDLREVVRATDKLLSRLIGEDIQVSLRVPEGPVEVLGNQGQIEQVLMNLATNARDAMPRGGKLTIEVSTIEFPETEVRARGLRGPGHVQVSVQDDGCGMDAETQARIFDPFFTTKEVGKGTGLGLSLAYGIVRQHGGFIEVTSAVGVGTTFRLYLPLAPAAGSEGAEAVSEPAPVAGLAPERGPRPPRTDGSELLLLAEDDGTVRAFAARVLRGAGYRVLEAADGEAAVGRFLEHRGEVALCVFDLVMPKCSGRAAWREIEALGTTAQVLFVSGYSPETSFLEMSAVEDAALLRKPYLPIELLTRIREILDEGRVNRGTLSAP
jgi:signal transduction histidine kinase/CheY-like chemotaxis protein